MADTRAFRIYPCTVIPFNNSYIMKIQVLSAAGLVSIFNGNNICALKTADFIIGLQVSHVTLTR